MFVFFDSSTNGVDNGTRTAFFAGTLEFLVSSVVLIEPLFDFVSFVNW